jgi:UDP-N-acetylmuramate--alanine ligase
MNLDLYKYIYLVGVGGIGMSALARYFNSKGKRVYGYDKVKSDLCIELENEGINIYYTDKLSVIPDAIKNSISSEVLVVYTAAISYENQVLSFFKDNGFKIFKRAEVLGMISEKSFTIAIAGTHGKTTTSTMLAYILKQAGKEITAFLGGVSHNYKTNFLYADKQDVLIVEADEFDRSFLQIHADIAIITSVGIDHLDVYKDINDLDSAFKQFASQVKENGILLVEESISIDFSVPDGGIKLNYSARNNADYFVENIRVKNGIMIFDILSNIDFDNTQKNIELQMPGIHNVSNALAAYVVSFYLGLSCNTISQGLATFKGIRRRFDKIIDTEKLVYIDDYAHHPDEVSATIDATKQLYPLRELIVVFQPHLFSRTKDLANEFARSLQSADDLVLLDIYPAREQPVLGINSQMLLDLCINPKKELCSKDDLLLVLKSKNIDVLLTLGAGDIGTLVHPIKHMLN